MPLIFQDNKIKEITWEEAFPHHYNEYMEEIAWLVPNMPEQQKIVNTNQRLAKHFHQQSERWYGDCSFCADEPCRSTKEMVA